MLAKAVAHHTTASFIRVVGSEFVQKYLGEVGKGGLGAGGGGGHACVQRCVVVCGGGRWQQAESPSWGGLREGRRAARCRGQPHQPAPPMHKAGQGRLASWLACAAAEASNLKPPALGPPPPLLWGLRRHPSPRFLPSLSQGPRMVRDVFRLAKQNAPSIIFVDEVDAIATARFDAQTGADRWAHPPLCSGVVPVYGMCVCVCFGGGGGGGACVDCLARSSGPGPLPTCCLCLLVSLPLPAAGRCSAS
jgi:hypothetical protein